MEESYRVCVRSEKVRVCRLRLLRARRGDELARLLPSSLTHPPMSDSSAMPPTAISPATLISKIFNTKIAPLSLAGSWDNVGLLVGELASSFPSLRLHFTAASSNLDAFRLPSALYLNLTLFALFFCVFCSP